MIYLGKILTKDDLRIYVYNCEVLVDPYFISYTIFDCTTGLQEIIRQTINSIPMKFDIGSYFVPLRIDPLIFRAGRHLVQWNIKQYCDTTVNSYLQDFYVSRQSFYAGEFCRSTYPNTTIANVKINPLIINFTRGLLQVF